jgi:DNA-binding transcriptional LysR family regulator
VRQSQLSRQLRELESALGRALFVRAGRKLTPTDAGEQLARVVRELKWGLSLAAAAEGRVRVRLAAGDSVMCWLVLPSLRALWRECPGVELEACALVAPQVVRALEEHEIDLALMRAGDDATDELKTVRVGRIGYGLFAARGLEVSRAPLAVPTTERALWPALQRLRAPTVECETFPQVAAAVRSGQVAGVLPTYARRELPAGEYTLNEVPELAPLATPLLLAWRRRADELRPELTPVRKALAQCIGRSL